MGASGYAASCVRSFLSGAYYANLRDPLLICVNALDHWPRLAVLAGCAH
jgi:hypothetical protein